ncbi:uncharacterized protein LOC112089225 [Eutrema salsugineum]|uniref:uncharacterized protein LOC112089225 n=1 Tax=Eutrema salsugineum TaxID=72664 RepID=UPI000CED10A1|nr:uncharacterized protein LOC112089225 [Eutrema salsugineum]
MGMYLGLPEQICGSKKKIFSFVHDRLSSRVNNWSARLLSKGGKEIQIKSVAQAVPTYIMSCFLLPQGITDKLRSAIANFWWSSKQNNSGIHWIAWDKICIPQDLGGLGFRDLNDFNLALLAKQLWRLIQYPNSLLAQVLRGRYFRQSDPLEDRKVYSPSYGWRSMLAAKPYLKQGLRKTIGSGLNTRVWNEPWIPDVRARAPRAAPQIGFQDPGMLVYHLIHQDTKQWDEPLLRVCFQPEDISLILGLRPTKNRTLDGYAWNHTKSGIFLVKSDNDLIRRVKLAQNTDVVGEPNTLIHAKIEAESWRSANKPEVDEDAIDKTTPIPLTPLSLPDAQRFPICQVDAFMDRERSGEWARVESEEGEE